ncbi:sushi, von Willebrand factor type A, EGF and pentraxin domain-containing protein 1-like, partial [Limulus polyphemus]|uniref:Sushi, von Willebrand factor type A, EGF and pentraxin domain-containing protein 1-like n=1 Tax=Limulus polyphemus TaxID=6850 RepID=A0ABM1TJK9_LIMPO
TRCPEPTTPRHGHLECSFPKQRFRSVAGGRNESKYVRGSTCRYLCDPGYVIPASLLTNSVIQCRGPYWNSTVDSECRKAVPPTPLNCVNQTLVTDDGVAPVEKPRFVAGDGRDLDVKCTLEGELEPGEYINTCKAIDPELRTNAECFYKLNIKSKDCSSPPEPVNGYVQCESETGRYFRSTVCIYKCNHGYVIPVSQSNITSIHCRHNSRWNSTKVPDCQKAVPPKPLDCIDQTLVAGAGGIQVKKPRFVTGEGKDADVKCSLEKPLKPGEYINVCAAVDPELQTSASCFQKVTVKAAGCLSPPEVQNGYIKCQPQPNSYMPGTVCMYHCSGGYVIPVSQSGITSRECLHDSSWNITKVPDCLKAVPPKTLDCIDQILVAGTGGVQVKKPKFITDKGEEIDPKCSLGRLLKPGKYTNVCVAVDPELRTSGRCFQRVVVKASECSTPPKTERGYMECRPQHGKYLPETVCKYHCHRGYVIPVSQSDISSRKCLHDSRWNTTKVPDCQKAVPPRPLDCIDQTLVAETGGIQVKKPSFLTEDGKDADVKCTLEKPLKPGEYINVCAAVDPELQTSASCFQKVTVKAAECRSPPNIQNGYTECHPQRNSYTSGTVCKYRCRDAYVIPVNQSAITSRYCRHDYKWNITEVPDCRKAVVPKPVDCNNKTVVAEGGMARVKKPKFVAGDGRDLDVECTLEDELEPGEYINTCTAADPELQTISKCSYTLKIKYQECSPPSLPSNGTIECWPKPESYPAGTVCMYLCYEGYVIPTSQSNVTSIYCRHDFKWNTTKVPNCWKTTTPKHLGCTNQVLTAEGGIARVTKPRFVTVDGRDLDVECTLEGELEPGEYINTCKATDPELQLSSLCVYERQNVTLCPRF